ncbi:hypothetical protein GIB67_025604 [Kingdonia uniflora]|uniref:Uncharacterized protein n=1 Tax=Kingdonia uniflora TaxID=39325 RepID=A0A7J7M0J3_9MAGN|nr:hypothetical protein GIB67_025604 [Kingdonia uniflora]
MMCLALMRPHINLALQTPQLINMVINLIQGRSARVFHDESCAKGRVFESQGIDHIVPCIGQSYLSRIAVELLFELLHDHSGWNISASKKLSEQSDAVLFLVMLLNTESAEKAEEILLQLCNDDDSNIIHAAAANWYKPLINRLVEG